MKNCTIDITESIGCLVAYCYCSERSGFRYQWQDGLSHVGDQARVLIPQHSRSVHWGRLLQSFILQKYSQTPFNGEGGESVIVTTWFLELILLIVFILLVKHTGIRQFF
jgi:hypothetical protein